MVQEIKNKMEKKKLIVMIPAYNEEKSIKEVIRSVPRKIDGISDVKVLVIDDGSKDETIKSAGEAGADIIIKNSMNLGLAKTFQRGMDYALKLGADIIVNTDADNQYNQAEIPILLKPILDGNADIVSGNRQIEKLTHMAKSKKYGNILGSKIVKLSAGYYIKDASSGFRAYNKESALRLFVTSKHTYTHETLIQAKHKNLKVIEVPVEFRKREGKSKLINNVGSHIKKSMATIVRDTLMYHSMKTLGYFGGLLILLGIYPLIRWVWLSYFIRDGGMHVQSLLLGLLLLMLGAMIIVLGFISDMIAINRQHLEEILYRTKKHEYEQNNSNRK